jgi:uncharacterized protein (DUF1778 family)
MTTASSTAHSKRARSETSISLRLPKAVLDLITSAAAASGKSRTEFMLESARREAVDVLLDQRFVQLDEAQLQDFMRALDHPPPPNKQLKRLLARKAPWEA